MSADDLDMVAAELALGLLEGDERSAAQRRVLSDPEFAAEVDAWRSRFAELFAYAPETLPPAALLSRVESSLLSERATPALERRRWIWPAIAAVSSFAAAILLSIILSNPTPKVAPKPASTMTQLAAALVGTENDTAFTAIYSPAGAELRLSAASLVDARHAAELWVIGPDGVPRSLGLLQRGRTTTLAISAQARAHLTPAAVLAVSVEPLGGSTTGKPTGAVIAKGTLALT